MKPSSGAVANPAFRQKPTLCMRCTQRIVAGVGLFLQWYPGAGDHGLRICMKVQAVWAPQWSGSPQYGDYLFGLPNCRSLNAFCTARTVAATFRMRWGRLSRRALESL